MDATTIDLEKIFIAYFNRPADAAGMSYWHGVVVNGQASLETVEAAFSTSSEYVTLHGNQSTTGVLSSVYLNLFGHAADLAGLLYWGGLVQQGALTLSQAVASISGGAQGTDLVSLNAKTNFATAYTIYTGSQSGTIDPIVGSAAMATVHDDASLGIALYQLITGTGPQATTGFTSITSPVPTGLHPQEADIALVGVQTAEGH